MSDPDTDDGLYDFAPQAPSPRPVARTTIKPVVSIENPHAPPVLPYRERKKDLTTPVDPEQIKHVYLPLWLLGGGVFIELLSTLIWTHHIGPALMELALDLTAGTGVMLLAMWIAAKVRGINLGRLGVAAYKLAAISIAPVAAAEFISPILSFIPFGFILVFIVQFVIFFALLGALFDLDESDTWYCVCVMFVTRTALYFALMAMFRTP